MIQVMLTAEQWACALGFMQGRDMKPREAAIGRAAVESMRDQIIGGLLKVPNICYNQKEIEDHVGQACD